MRCSIGCDIGKGPGFTEGGGEIGSHTSLLKDDYNQQMRTRQKREQKNKLFSSTKEKGNEDKTEKRTER